MLRALLVTIKLQQWRQSQDHSVIWISKSNLGPTSADSLYAGPEVVCAKTRKESVIIKEEESKIKKMKHIYNSGILGMQLQAVTLALYCSKGMTGFSLIKTWDFFSPRVQLCS